MDYEIRTEVNKDTAEKLRIDFDENMRPTKDGCEPHGRMTFYFRPLTGRDEAAIADLMVRVSDDQQAIMKTGTTNREKCIRSVFAIDGLRFRGAPAERMTPELYDSLDRWIVMRLIKKVQEMSGEEESLLGE